MKRIFLIIATVLSLLGPSLALSSTSLAAAVDCSNPMSAKDQIQCGACDAAGTTGTACQPANSGSTLTSTIRQIIDVISLIAGAVAVLMIIIAGFRYVASAGSPETAKSAKNTILYAIIGLVIIGLAQVIVHFTLNTVTGACNNGKTPSGQKCS